MEDRNEMFHSECWLEGWKTPELQMLIGFFRYQNWGETSLDTFYPLTPESEKL